jgi:hypothetical protein
MSWHSDVKKCFKEKRRHRLDEFGMNVNLLLNTKKAKETVSKYCRNGGLL